jgi:XTP/dITP diphosphohydrolase
MRKLERGMKLVVASHNKGKVWEIHQLLAPYGLEAVSAAELGLAEPNETETTFRGNALIKARAAAESSGLPALADDSGLEINALGGAPGVYAADWAGPAKDFGLAMQHVHDALERCGAWKAKEAPRANFISVLCLAWPGGEHSFYEGRVFGHLVWPPRGGNGFGYDPLFVADGQKLTFGEMEPPAKYAISHRTHAFAAFKHDCLNFIAPEHSGKSEGRDLEALAAAAANLSTKDELIRFIANLRADLSLNRKAQENSDLARYLEAMEAWLQNSDIKEEPRWRTFARALLAASRSE